MLTHRKRDYPVTVHFAENYPDKTDEIFLSYKPHKGNFIGVALLSYIPFETLESIFDDLATGEKLIVFQNDNRFDRLSDVYVKREDGFVLGKLPHCESLVPDALMSRGIRVYAFLEAKSSNEFYAKLLISVYAEDY